MTHRQKRIFFNWLQKHGILKQYRQNIFASSKVCQWRNPSYKSMSFIYAIDDAFTWRYTPEGYSFWSDLNYAWSSFARKLQYDT